MWWCRPAIPATLEAEQGSLELIACLVFRVSSRPPSAPYWDAIISQNKKRKGCKGCVIQRERRKPVFLLFPDQCTYIHLQTYVCMSNFSATSKGSPVPSAHKAGPWLAEGKGIVLRPQACLFKGLGTDSWRLYFGRILKVSVEEFFFFFFGGSGWFTGRISIIYSPRRGSNSHEMEIILLPQPAKCWHYRCIPTPWKQRRNSKSSIS